MKDLLDFLLNQRLLVSIDAFLSFIFVNPYTRDGHPRSMKLPAGLPVMARSTAQA